MSKKDRFGLLGNTIAGTFRVDEVVAEGGFGIVYRAFHLHFRSPVALKCLKIPGELSQQERTLFLEQFRSEAEIQFRLSAILPNIVRPLQVDAVTTKNGDFVPIMALEWLEGLSFEKIIERRSFSGEPPMPLDEAMELISPAAQALHEAHHFEIDGEPVMVVHRDIKPDNLFVTEVGGKKIVKLLDFGISKVRRAASELAGHASQTDTHAPFSPAYGAPEQWAPKRFGPTGPWTDVWGLALTLVEIIKGDAVIVGDHQAMMGTTLDSKVRPTPRSEGVRVSEAVESVFQKALSLEPRFRYQSVQAFWDALSAAIALFSQPESYDETPSGRRIPLPAMRPPTPWTPPHRRLEQEDPTPLEHLPPMMAPAALAPTEPEDGMSGQRSYPMDPHSDLQPVPAAPTNFSHLDSEIPPISDEHDHVGPYPQQDEPPLIAPVTEQGESKSLASEHPLLIELQPTSTFPEERKSSPQAWLDVVPEEPEESVPELELPPASANKRAMAPVAPRVARNKPRTPPPPPPTRREHPSPLNRAAVRHSPPPPPRKGPPKGRQTPPSSTGSRGDGKRKSSTGTGS